MGEPAPPTHSPGESSDDRLDSWKEIAEYLRRDVTTVQRWEKRERMPVRRHLHDKAGSVYAYPADLDEWIRNRSIRNSEENAAKPPTETPPPAIAASSAFPRWKLILIASMLLAMAACASGLWLLQTEYIWRNPIADAQFQRLTDFDGVAQDAAVSRDGHFVAFLSDRDGPLDIWVTQVGSGDFHNLTNGKAPELANSAIRVLRFSPDGSLVTFWGREQTSSANISIWAVPTLGGQPKPYLIGAAELDWSPDGSRLAYHTSAPGDPLYVSDASPGATAQLLFSASAGLHSHFPLWSRDSAFLYFVEGSLPDKLDIWRIAASGGSPVRITSQNARVTHPVLLDRRTLLYLANDTDGSGPWLYGTNVDRRVPHRLTSGLDQYTSLDASADGRRLALTLASTKSTLWTMPIGDSPTKASAPSRIDLTTSTGFAPRLGPDYLVYVSAKGTGESIWKSANGTDTELWNQEGAHVFGTPAISQDGKSIAFSVRQHGSTALYTMQADGSNARILTSSLNLEGAPAWSPDDKSITSAADDHGVPHLFRIPLDGDSPSALIPEYSLDPAWAPDGSFVLYSGADVGTNFSVQAATPQAVGHPLPALNMTRGARHLVFANGGRSLIVLRGEIQHKNLWLVDLDTGAERQITNLSPDFDVRDFDVSPDGREVVLERSQARSDVVLVDIPKR